MILYKKLNVYVCFHMNYLFIDQQVESWGLFHEAHVAYV